MDSGTECDLFFLPDAFREYEDSYLYYESQEFGLGDRFRVQIADRIEAIRRDPTSFPLVHQDIRETLVRKFPFAVYFSVVGTVVLVVAVHHCSLPPEVWQGRRH